MFETLERKALEMAEALLKALGGSGQREEEVVVEHRGMRFVARFGFVVNGRLWRIYAKDGAQGEIQADAVRHAGLIRANCQRDAKPRQA